MQNGVGINDYLTELKYFNPWIMHTGAITWVPEIRVHSKCNIIIKDFPFDEQCCEINFYSWAHTARQMSIMQVDNKRVTNTTHVKYIYYIFILIHFSIYQKLVYLYND